MRHSSQRISSAPAATSATSRNCPAAEPINCPDLSGRQYGKAVHVCFVSAQPRAEALDRSAFDECLGWGLQCRAGARDCWAACNSPGAHDPVSTQSPRKPHHTTLLFGRRARELHAYNQPSHSGIIGLALPSYDAKRPQSMHPGRQAGFARQDVDTDVVVVPFIAARRAGHLVWASKRLASINFLRQQSIRRHLMPTLKQGA